MKRTTINDWVIKDEDGNKKDKHIIEDAIRHNNKEIPI